MFGVNTSGLVILFSEISQARVALGSILGLVTVAAVGNGDLGASGGSSNSCVSDVAS